MRLGAQSSPVAPSPLTVQPSSLRGNSSPNLQDLFKSIVEDPRISRDALSARSWERSLQKKTSAPDRGVGR